MIEKLIIAILPALISSVVTYSLSKKSKMKNFKSDKRRAINKSTFNFFTLTNWVYVNSNKMLFLQGFFCAWYGFYVLYRKFVYTDIPPIGPIIIPMNFILCFIYTLLMVIDKLFNQEGKK